jgi:aminoglycoside phosphotransferase
MNVVASYLAAHRDAPGLKELGLPDDPSFVLITPRFAQSRHVVVLVLAPGATRPVLAVKLPRLAGDGAALAREAANLEAAGRALGHDGSVPPLLAFDPERTHPLLVQGALTGAPLGPAAVRRDPAAAVALIAGWCDRLAAATAQPADRAQVERLAVAPLLALAEAREASDELHELAQRTLPLARGLLAAELPLVFEHGDLGHPNLMVGDDGALGVLDFESARPAGLPGHDLAFACAYAATVSARRPDPALAGEAFHGTDPWAAPVLAAHLLGLGIAREHHDALLAVACGRVVAQAVADGRVVVANGRDAAARHLALWRSTLGERPAAGGPGLTRPAVAA